MSEQKKYEDNMLEKINLIIQGRPSIYTEPNLYKIHIDNDKITIDYLLKKYYEKFPINN